MSGNFELDVFDNVSSSYVHRRMKSQVEVTFIGSFEEVQSAVLHHWNKYPERVYSFDIRPHEGATKATMMLWDHDK